MIKNSIKNFIYVIMLTVFCFGGCVGCETEKNSGGNRDECGVSTQDGGFGIAMFGETPVGQNRTKVKVEQLEQLYQGQEVKIDGLEVSNTVFANENKELCQKIQQQRQKIKRLKTTIENHKKTIESKVEQLAQQFTTEIHNVRDEKLDALNKKLAVQGALIGSLEQRLNSSASSNITIRNESSGGQATVKTGDTTATSSVEQALLGDYPVFYKYKKISFGVLLVVLAFLAQRPELGIGSVFFLGYGLYETKETIKKFTRKVAVLTGGACFGGMALFAALNSNSSDDAFGLSMVALGSLGGSVLYCATTS